MKQGRFLQMSQDKAAKIVKIFAKFAFENLRNVL